MIEKFCYLHTQILELTPFTRAKRNFGLLYWSKKVFVFAKERSDFVQWTSMRGLKLSSVPDLEPMLIFHSDLTFGLKRSPKSTIACHWLHDFRTWSPKIPATVVDYLKTVIPVENPKMKLWIRIELKWRISPSKNLPWISKAKHSWVYFTNEMKNRLKYIC